MPDMIDENVEITNNGQTAENVEQNHREDDIDENVDITLNRDDATVARRLHEISAKKNEWKRRAEEYKRRLEELQNKTDGENVEKVAAPDDMERVFKEDIMAIKRAFPYVRADDVRDLPNLKTFAKLRDAGLGAVEAYRASSADEIIERAIAGKKTGAADNRSHLTAIGAETRAKSLDAIPSEMLPIWRSAFPKLSEKELVLLYNKNK